MKRILFVVLAALAASVSLSAQSTGMTIRAGYSPYTIKDDGASINTSGLMAGFSAGNYVSTSVPLYVDYGVDLHYAWKSWKMDGDRLKLNCLSAVIPVNIGYKFDVQGSVLSFSPYAGLAAGINIVANSSFDGESGSLFDGDDGGTWKRLQLGAQVGIKVTINDRIVLGYEFRPFITEVAEATKSSYNTFFIGLPLNF